jgi:hypothetical protein
VTGRHTVDRGVDLDPVLDDRRDQLAGQVGGYRLALRVGQMALEDGLRGALAEVGFEDRGERQSPPGATPSLAVSLRRHRR